MSPPPLYPFFLLLCFFSLPSGIQSDDLQILMKLKSTLGTPNPNVFNSWESSNSMCNFTGITCNSKGSVTEVNLSNQNLTGVLPLDSICQLQSLEKLSFGFNKFNVPIMEELKNCVKLQYLDLGNNFFTGSVPDMSSLSQLQYLYLNNSGFSGNFPWESLKNVTGLVQLSIGDNPFSPSQIPNWVVQHTKLNWLYLSNCNLQGTIPAGIGNLKELINFEFSNNNMTGNIPEEIGNLVNLWQLEFYNNSITGKLPYQPSSVQFKKLVNLSLYRNSLTGPLPQNLGSWAKFIFIDVSENLLTGPIPPDMCKQGTMRGLLMLENKFTGEIPASYADCSTLLRFRVNNNSLSGTVPSGIWGLPNVNIIDITLNSFEGPITSDIKNAKSLSQLFVANNLLSGELPAEISEANSLVSIQLNDNQLSGNIPTNIGDLKQLSALHLQNNKLSGSIPDTLGSCDSLTDINIANNSFLGDIPSSLGSLPTLNSLNLSYNQFSGEIPQSFGSLRLSLLDLSHNRLTGPVPQALSIAAYNGSFAGNSGLCSLVISSFPKCPSGSPLVCCFKLKKTDKAQSRSLKDESWDFKSFHVLSFTEDEILDSIKQENLIGTGGSGNVYKVAASNGKELAVKHIWNTDRNKSRSTTPMLSKRAGKSKEFDAEVQTLSSIRHVNVVKLFCSITSEDSSLLVYEYLPNGSLWDRLHMSQKMELDWDARYEIAVGAAKGLEYLHHGCERPVIHRDVKSSNILLDEHLKPRIADFGLAKILQANSGKDSTHVIAGTHGYIAPEYGYTYKVNEKSDVYSFGVVLMELVSGKRPIEPEFGENKDIVNWVSSKIKTRDSVLSVVDSRIPEVLKEEAIKVLRIAILCTATLPSLRPTMRSVVQMLEEAEPCKLVGIDMTKDGASKNKEVTGTGKLNPDT
uniref:non-specific serine/threonine protein kinase n=1 Tax=Fagus sylvatica TaxID=28930 RepID=A0A2N9HMQ4_FAGSY